MKHTVIIGAGFGGLAAGAELSRAGLDVTVLEAHIYPGGCAGTFYHKGYRFDAGATLAGGFAPGAPMDRLARHFEIDWEARPASRAMQVHLPDESTITRWTDSQRWERERRAKFGNQAEPFWRWQENAADALWGFALRLPPWPPQTMSDLLNLCKSGLASPGDMLKVAPDSLRPVAAHLKNTPDRLRIFLDAQLLISAQTTSASANALYSAAALDLARQGVAHVPNGMGGMAEKLVKTIQRHGGRVRFRQEVTHVSKKRDGVFTVKTKRGDSLSADMVIFNLPPWNIPELLDGAIPSRLQRLPEKPRRGWGAFVAYVGLDDKYIPVDLALHHQVLQGEPFGEGNSIFISLSPSWDKERAPDGKRALTISTHTQLQPWWDLYEGDPDNYEARKKEYLERMLSLAKRVIPGIRQGADLLMPGTPVTFQHFTRRTWGWVGGFPQTNLFQAWGPRLEPGLWMVGDTIFPGQSVPAVMLGGLRVAQTIIAEGAKSRRTCRRPHKFQAQKAGD
ncbi:MAG: NAD(P)/FAD-dependent oxidoreductase [Anaerolineales bacterium]|nr:NAD(P)/FAD-dependent oxidoreductase [Anaerolineales bacterium]